MGDWITWVSTPAFPWLLADTWLIPDAIWRGIQQAKNNEGTEL